MALDRCTDTNPHPAHTTDGTHCPGVPVPRPAPSLADRMADDGDRPKSIPIREIHIFDKETSGHIRRFFDEIDELTARAATAERERDVALDERDEARAHRRQLTADIQAAADNNDQLRAQLAYVEADCARYATERDEARECEQLLTAELRQTRQKLTDTRAERDRLLDANKAIIGENHNLRDQLDRANTERARLAAASVPSRRAQDAEDEPVKIRGVRVHRPDPERSAVDPERPIHLEIAGVAYAELNAAEARQIARQLIGETLERERELPAPKLATGGIGTPVAHSPTSPTGDPTDGE
jgi:hypothetical protein